MTTLEIEKMGTAERLETIEMLWDALCHDETDIKSPAWHEDVLNARMQRIESGEATFLTLEQLKERLRK
jgi:putative addiction module component (TIGR02574 family)